MGNVHPSRNLRATRTANTRRILFLGLEGVGKSALVNALSAGDPHRVVPTAASPRSAGGAGGGGDLGSGSGAVTEFTAAADHKRRWQLVDLRGDSASRVLWTHSYLGVTGVVFVLSAADADRLPTALQELREVASSPSLEGCPIIVVLNKADAAKGDQLPSLLVTLGGEVAPLKTHAWTAVAVSARSGAGLPALTSWLADNMKAL